MNEDHQLMLVASIAAQCSSELPSELMLQLEEAERQLAQGEWPESSVSRGTADRNFSKIKDAVLGELRDFLCTDSERYTDLRKRAGGLTESSILGIAGFIAGSIGLPLGLASAATAFLALAILKVGVGAFCRLVPSGGQ